MTPEEALRLVCSIRFDSVDKDNMEFTARVSCYQRDAITELVWLVDPEVSTSERIARDIREGTFRGKSP